MMWLVSFAVVVVVFAVWVVVALFALWIYDTRRRSEGLESVFGPLVSSDCSDLVRSAAGSWDRSRYWASVGSNHC